MQVIYFGVPGRIVIVNLSRPRSTTSPDFLSAVVSRRISWCWVMPRLNDLARSDCATNFNHWLHEIVAHHAAEIVTSVWPFEANVRSSVLTVCVVSPVIIKRLFGGRGGAHVAQ